MESSSTEIRKQDGNSSSEGDHTVVEDAPNQATIMDFQGNVFTREPSGKTNDAKGKSNRKSIRDSSKVQKALLLQ